MFSYRHAFHAGNHADVLKHVVLIEILTYVSQKETMVFYIDTHAGAGMYALHHKEAQKNKEFDSGIAKLWNEQHLVSELHPYLEHIQAFNPEGILQYYPGSPALADRVLREKDRLRLFEWHPTEIEVLKQHVLKKQTLRKKRILVEYKDGFKALKSQVPPPSRRAVVLIDPSYENKDDYAAVIQTLKDALKRFEQGVYIVWYPLVSRAEAKRFPTQLQKLPVTSWLNVSLTVKQPPSNGFGLYGSALFIINPPWTLKRTLDQVMPYLTKQLGVDSFASYTLIEGPQK